MDGLVWAGDWGLRWVTQWSEGGAWGVGLGRPQDVVPGALESRGLESSGGSEGGAWE